MNNNRNRINRVYFSTLHQKAWNETKTYDDRDKILKINEKNGTTMFYLVISILI